MIQYDLMRMLHFANKLQVVVRNAPRKSLNEHAPLRITVPLHETQDAIEQMKLHVERLIETEKAKGQILNELL